jgi:hypothetical protein
MVSDSRSNSGCGERVGVSWIDLARAGCVVPGSLEDVAELAKAIWHRERDYWIVVLTARPGESVPSLSPIAVRELVGADVPVYFLKRRFAVHLESLLPPKMHVHAGAVRIYRPGVTDDPWDHPLLRDPSGEYGQGTLERLGAIFTPKVGVVPELSAEQRVLALEHERSHAAKTHARELSVLRARYEACALGKHEDRATRGWPWWGKERARHDLGCEMRLLIEAQWAAFLPSHARHRHPICSYGMTPRFLSDVAQGVGKVPMDRVAWVCSLVICQFDVRRVGLESGPLKPSRDAQHLTGEGGASVRWCNLRRRSQPGRAPRVVYWAHLDDVFELVGLGYPNDEAIGHHG